MTESDQTAPAEGTGGTGVPAVDEAVRSTEDLQDAPVGDHVAVFERAHASLRAALDEAGGGPTRT